MRLRRAALLLAVSAVLPACGQLYKGEGGEFHEACTLEARPSVRVTVVDTQGNPRRDARVTYTRDGGPEQQAECLRSEAGHCEWWLTEPEQPGLFVLTATSADGQRTVRQQVTVTETEDKCHVLTETVRLTLPD
ncbi:hypothetical protein [Archangium sp.]|jgi:hypothetical protein|uniref:hypothetical protein n=1 Tax=Archangium sp. TaxID=1872627 RepID=UPI002ED9FFE3